MSYDQKNEHAERRVSPAPRCARVHAKGASCYAIPTPHRRVVAGRYPAAPRLGTGRAGVVWTLARDGVLGGLFALKEMAGRESEIHSDALRDARAAVRVSHPGVLEVHQVIAGDNNAWIDRRGEGSLGQPLSAEVREGGRLLIRELAQVGLLLARVEAVHGADLVRHDLRASNIWLGDGALVVITEFGLHSPRGVWGGPRVGGVAGTLYYLRARVDHPRPCGATVGPVSTRHDPPSTSRRILAINSGAPLTVEAVASSSPLRPKHGARAGRDSRQSAGQ